MKEQFCLVEDFNPFGQLLPLCLGSEEDYAPVVFDKGKAQKFVNLNGSGELLEPTTLKMVLRFQETNATGIALNPSVPPMISDVVRAQSLF